MEHQVLALAFSVSFCLVLYGSRVHGSVECITRACYEVDDVISCNKSLILVSDVTNWKLERDHRTLENMKRACMGRPSCDPSQVCGQGDRRSLVVHYFCVNGSHIRSKTCNRQVELLKGESGYIQSPGYPGVTPSYRPCRWRIEPPNGSVVVLTLHDVATIGGREQCDGGLVVSGRACDGEGHAFAPRLLCGMDRLHSLMRCGQVDIELSPSKRVYPLRFWLSFHVHSKQEPHSLKASLLPCSGWLFSMGDGNKQKETSSRPKDTTVMPVTTTTEDTNIHLLIVMLSVISGISAVLFIILIVVCVRCRLLRAPSSENVYSEPSPALQAHYEYIASLEAENDDKPRPHLADGYFEVADALPISQRGEQPASPAYAEVEQFAPLRKGPWSSQRETGNVSKSASIQSHEGSATLPRHIEVIDVRTPRKVKSTDKSKRHYANVTISNNGKPSSSTEYSNEIEIKRPRRGMLDRLKGDRNSKQSDKDRKTGSASPQGSPKSRFKNSSDRKGPRVKDSAPPPPPAAVVGGEEDSVIYETCDSSAYEPVNLGTPAAGKLNKKTTSAIKGASQTQATTTMLTSKDKNSTDSEKALASVMDGKVKTTGQSRNANPDELVVKQHVDGAITGNRLTTHNAGKSNSSCGSVSLQRDLPKTKGIVKNGIKKFEGNDALS
ncbi:uncharacterized protein LOC101851179 [Aplysia californica]|uniref:Uncharacterized protein LOC101851179 n=1 Tax=Aplysia californica TaxID=6500 RepID=A0ABM0ZVN8_APLCA|nr:uncharacterized protein LOC101851179 [Aplysia californica]